MVRYFYCRSFSFENSSGSHTSANAHGNNTEFLVSSLQLGEKGYNHAGSGHTERVANSKGAASWVKFLLRDSELLDGVGSLTSKGFVDLENVNLVDVESAVLEGSGDSESGANSHNLGWDSGGSVANETANDLRSELVSVSSGGEHNSSGTIGHLGGVSSSGASTLLESGLQLAKFFKCGSWTGAIIDVDSNFLLVSVLVGDLGLVWSDLRLGPSHLVGMESLGVRVDGELILHLSGDTVLGGDILGSDTHGHEAVTGDFVVVDLF